MALKIYEKFAPRANVGDTNYPNGSIKNESAPGANDGTPLDADWGNDYAGFDAALFAEAGITPSGDPDTVLSSQRLSALQLLHINNLSIPYVFDTVTDIETDSVNIPLGKNVKWLGKITIDDGLGAEGVVVAPGTGIEADGYITMQNGMQVKPKLGKFTISYDTIRGNSFMQIYNWVDELQIGSFADSTSIGDAHVFNLPFDVRRDSHGYILTAGSFGGQTDIDFRTNGFSDYVLLRCTSTLGSEFYQILYDKNPARNDGTKKDGSGGGGLTPTEDTYDFDAAMSVPSNRTTDPVAFSSLGVLFQNYFSTNRRSGGLVEFRRTINASDEQLTETMSGNDLGALTAISNRVGNKTFYSTTILNPLGSDGSHSYSPARASISSNTSRVYQLSSVGQFIVGRLKVVAVGSGGGFGVKDISFSYDGSTVIETENQTSSLPAQISAALSNNAGVLELTIAYTSGLGGSARFSLTVDWDSVSR